MFIKSSITKNDPVNIDHCVTFTKAKGSNAGESAYYIIFAMSNAKAVQWGYDNKDERDSAYIRLLKIVDEVVI